MISYNVPINAQRMTIGVQGENNVREFLFDVTEWRQITGDIGAAEMVVQRAGDSSPYAAVITMHDENTVSWVPTSTDTAKTGAGKIQLMWIASGQTVKTKIFDMKVDPSLDYAVPDDSLDPWSSWMPNLLNADARINSVESGLQDVRERQTSPYNFKGSCTESNLPATAEINDTWYLTDQKYRVTWTGEDWQQSSLDESEYEDELAEVKNGLHPLDHLQSKQASFDPYNTDMSDFTTALSSDAWLSGYVYGAGTVESITYRKRQSGSANITFFIIDPETKMVIDKYNSDDSSQQVTFTINKKYTKDFMVGVYSVNLGYRTGGKYDSYYFNASGVKVGDAITPTQYGKLDFSFYLEYVPINIEVTKLENYGDTHSYTINNISIDSGFSDSDANWWASEFHYPAGYVGSIRAVPNTDATPELEIIDSVLNKVVYKGKANDNIFVVEQLCENDFYVFVKGVKYSTGITSWPNYYSHPSVPSTLDVGSLFSPIFATGGYVFAVEITYKTVLDSSLVLKPSGLTKMFACGDSITAGYPYIPGQPYAPNEDIRWGRQVARRLEFDIDFGASSGNGWVYSTGSANAYTITRDTDFSAYDVAVYAWGTNDYGHDAPLGDVDDDPSQVLTVCSRIKWIVNKIYTDNPGIVLILSLPLNRSDFGTKDTNWGYGTPNEAGYTLSEMCDKIIELCELHGIPYIDNRASAFNRYSLAGLTVDGLHPNYRGYKILGAHLAGEIGRIVSPYCPDAFTECNPL